MLPPFGRLMLLAAETDILPQVHAVARQIVSSPMAGFEYE